MSSPALNYELRGDPRLKHILPAVIALALYDLLCTVFPREERKNRTPPKMKRRGSRACRGAAEGK
jgi:hypothetical protein